MSRPGHGEVELDVVAGIIPTTSHGTAVWSLVVEARVSTPLDAVVLWELTAALSLVEQEGQAESLTPVPVSCRKRVYGTGRRQAGWMRRLHGNNA